jgi:hypothetical protein
MHGERKDPIKCPECALRCLATALGFGKVLLLDPTDKDTRSLFIGELLNAENHLGILNHTLQRLAITNVRTKPLSPSSLDEIRKVWKYLADKGRDFMAGIRYSTDLKKTPYIKGMEHLSHCISLHMEALNEQKDIRADILGEWMCSELSFLMASAEEPRKRLGELRRAWQLSGMPLDQDFMRELEVIRKNADVDIETLSTVATTKPSSYKTPWNGDVSDTTPPKTPDFSPSPVNQLENSTLSGGVEKRAENFTDSYAQTDSSKHPVWTNTPPTPPPSPAEPLKPIPLIIIPNGYPVDSKITKALLSTYMKGISSIHYPRDLSILVEKNEKVLVCHAGTGPLKAWSLDRLEPMCEMRNGSPFWDYTIPNVCETESLYKVWENGTGDVLTRYHVLKNTPPKPLPPMGWVVTVDKRLCCSLARNFRASLFVRWNDNGRPHLLEALGNRKELKGLLDGADSE